MSVNVTPLHDRVLIKRIEEKETVKGGIIIPDTAKEKPQEGEVIAAGAGKIEKGERIPLDVKAGDRVLFGKYSGTEIKVEEEDYLILREDEMLANLTRSAKSAPGKMYLFPCPRCGDECEPVTDWVRPYWEPARKLGAGPQFL